MLTALVDKSLVVYEEPQGEARYRLLETIRQYAARSAGGERGGSDLPPRHRDYFLALAEEADKKLKGPDQGQWLNRLGDRTRQPASGADIVFGRRGGDEIGLKLGAALQRFWQIRGHLSEGCECLTALLAAPEVQVRTKARADALNAAGRLTFAQGDYASARPLYEESLQIGQELEDRQGIAISPCSSGELAWRQGD